MHTPVMVDEVDTHLEPSRGGVFVDCTIGLGGHARRMLDAGATRVIGIDRDPDALAQAREALRAYGDRVSLVHSDYRNLVEVLDASGIDVVDGVLADLGVSSMQLDSPDRGFSFRRDEPLDMRMDRSSGATAADMLATVDERTLADVIYEFGEERHARRVARAIVEAGSHAANRDDGTAGGDRPEGGAAERLFAHRPGDADVPGDSHLGQSRTRRPRRVPDARGRPARAGRAPGGDYVPFAGGPRREAHAADVAGERRDHHPDQAAAGADGSRDRTESPRAKREVAGSYAVRQAVRT